MLEPKFVEIEGYRIRYREGGGGLPLLMVHGVGPGTSAVGNFGPMLERLAGHYRVIAMDLIGFGDSDRKRAPPWFDPDLWLRQCLAALELLAGDGPCAMAGHSLGGALALRTAARAPQIRHVLASSAIGAAYPLNPVLDAFWSPPADRAALRRAMADMVYDPAAVTDEMLDARWALLTQEGYGAYFRDMFAGDRQRFLDAMVLSGDEIAAIEANVTLIHGREDRPCPPELTAVALAERLPRADLILLGRCGHNLPREQPEKYLAAAHVLLGG